MCCVPISFINKTERKQNLRVRRWPLKPLPRLIRIFFASSLFPQKLFLCWQMNLVTLLNVILAYLAFALVPGPGSPWCNSKPVSGGWWSSDPFGSGCHHYLLSVADTKYPTAGSSCLPVWTYVVFSLPHSPARSSLSSWVFWPTQNKSRMAAWCRKQPTRKPASKQAAFIYYLRCPVWVSQTKYSLMWEKMACYFLRNIKQALFFSPPLLPALFSFEIFSLSLSFSFSPPLSNK